MDWWIYKKCATSQILSVASWEACSLSSLIDTYILKIKNTRKVQGKLCCLTVTDVTAISHWQEQADENRTKIGRIISNKAWLSKQLLQINLTRYSYFVLFMFAFFEWQIGDNPQLRPHCRFSGSCDMFCCNLLVAACRLATCSCIAVVIGVLGY